MRDEERAYWRKLRGNIFIALVNGDWSNTIKGLCRATDEAVDTLKAQEDEFFDKNS